MKPISVRLPNGTVVRVDTTKFGSPDVVVHFSRGGKPFEGLPELAHALLRAFRFDALGHPCILLGEVPVQYQEALSRASIVTESGEPVRTALVGAGSSTQVQRRRSRWGRFGR